MNRQLALTDAVKGIRAQGGPAMTRIEPISCLYFGNGVKCALGHLFDPAQYSENFEGNDLESLPSIADAINSRYGEITSDDIEFLDALQCAHDTVFREADFIRLFEENIAKLAHIYGLEVPAP